MFPRCTLEPDPQTRCTARRRCPSPLPHTQNSWEWRQTKQSVLTSCLLTHTHTHTCKSLSFYWSQHNVVPCSQQIQSIGVLGVGGGLFWHTAQPVPRHTPPAMRPPPYWTAWQLKAEESTEKALGYLRGNLRKLQQPTSVMCQIISIVLLYYHRQRHSLSGKKQKILYYICHRSSSHNLLLMIQTVPFIT